MAVKRPPASAIPGLGRPGAGAPKAPPKVKAPKGAAKKKGPAKKKAPKWTKRPVTPGSAMTLGGLNRAANAAVKTQYGPAEAAERRNVGQARTYARDVGGPGGFYDQYLKQLAGHTANVNTIAAQGNAAVGRLPGQVTGLATADLSSLQGQANAGAAARGMGPAGDLAPMASNAAAVRQAITGSFAAQQAAQNSAAQTYADTLAHVVGPTQKLAGQAIAQGKIKTERDKLTELMGRKGAAKSKYIEETKASEAKNVLAMQVAGLGAQTKAAATVETTRSHKAQEAIDRARIRAETRRAQAAARTAGSKTILSGAFAGKSQGWLSSATDAQKRSLIAAYDAKHGKAKPGAKPKTGGLTRGQQNQGLTQVAALKGYLQTAKAGAPLPKEGRPGWKNVARSQDYAMNRVRRYVGGSLKNPWLVNAAGDAAYQNHLWGNTERNLKAQGYSPQEVAAALGTKTMAEWLKTPAGRNWAMVRKNTQVYGKANPQPQGHY